MKKPYCILVFLVFLFGCNTNQRKDISFESVKNFDLDNVLKKANSNEKSVLLYFSSVACVNCRKIEAKILNTPTIKQTILDKYILVTLIVDDREIAEENYWKESRIFNRTLKKIGAINSDWQIELTQTGSQPYFAIINKEKTILSEMGYTRSDNEILNFLNK
ncbi:thioredoxin family protein [uncultured Algibacter sp.]|uniref:thioredoxin family protein n=1 Tax=uncultured Algibacter sp. TaxID=298659 RepID=UPI0032178B8A